MWTEVAAAGLPQPFQVFRQVFAEMLTSKFQIDVTPDEFTLLALKMSPSINTTLDGPQLRNKSAKAEIMHGVYVRALRRQARIRLTKHASVQPAAAEAGAEAPAHAEANDGSCAPPVTTPQPKRRRSLLGAVAGAQQVAPVTAVGDELDQSELDDMVKGEIDTFTLISSQTIAKGNKSDYYQGGGRFNLRLFWADHSTSLPIHAAVYVAQVGCMKSAAGHVESVFSGAGKFTEAGHSAGSTLLRRYVKLHYNSKYKFLQIPIEDVVARYKQKRLGAKSAAARSRFAAPADAAPALASSPAASPAAPAMP